MSGYGERSRRSAVVLSLFKQFKKWGETQPPTFAYWVMLLGAVQLMLPNIT